MNLQDYRDQNQNVKPNADIIERWQKRIVAGHLSGMQGGIDYLARYGTNISFKKVKMLARQAENMGDCPMSELFWAKAHEIEFGEPATGAFSSRPNDVIVMTIAPEEAVTLDDFPADLQPGTVATAQPVDAAHDRDCYIDNPDYFGQPKIDGQKAVAFVTSTKVIYQSRSTKLRQTPSAEMDEALMKAASRIGSFIVEGEVTYLDCDGGEHRTAAQAATHNINCGAGAIPPEMQFCVFDCLYHGQDLRERGKSARLFVARTLVLHVNYDNCFVVGTAETGEAKKQLVKTQIIEGREGEVWFRKDLPYLPGKVNDEGFVRTKYLQEFEADIISVAPPTADGHFIGGFEIADDEGNSLGKIGTGYSREDQQEILKRFAEGDARAQIRCQGFTENGLVWHGRFIGWA